MGRIEKVLGYLLSVFVLIALTAMLFPTVLSRSGMFAIYPTVVLLAMSWLIPSGIKRSTKKKVERHGYFLCPWCRYTLQGLPEVRNCPECGAGYQQDVCETLYICAYRPFNPDRRTLAQRESRAWRAAIILRDQGL